MAITRLNHAVLYVRDVRQSARFYQDVLDFRPVHELPGAVFLQASDSTNDHDLGLFEIGSTAAASAAGRGTVGLYHLAWSVPTLRDLAEYARRLSDAGALAGASDHVTTKALYAHDPDGLEFEVSWLVPLDRVTPEMRAAVAVHPLDLAKELREWGEDLVGAH